MAAEIFKAISNLRFALDTETDADSPDNETTYGTIREAIEYLVKILLSDGFTGTASANPPDNNTGVLTHAGAAQDTDEHNGRTLMITSGNAVGNFYTIDDTAAQTITCTGDNLYSDGIRSGDYFEILYDIMTNTDGHDHDGVNSKISAIGGGSAGAAILAAADAEDGIEYDTGALYDQWVELTTWRVYIPLNADTIRMASRQKEESGGAQLCKVRFSVDGNDSTNNETSSAAYVWLNDATLDVSALSGWLDLDIEMWMDANGGDVARLRGYTFIYE